MGEGIVGEVRFILYLFFVDAIDFTRGRVTPAGGLSTCVKA